MTSVAESPFANSVVCSGPASRPVGREVPPSSARAALAYAVEAPTAGSTEGTDRSGRGPPRTLISRPSSVRFAVKEVSIAGTPSVGLGPRELLDAARRVVAHELERGQVAGVEAEELRARAHVAEGHVASGRVAPAGEEAVEAADRPRGRGRGIDGQQREAPRPGAELAPGLRARERTFLSGRAQNVMGAGIGGTRRAGACGGREQAGSRDGQRRAGPARYE